MSGRKLINESTIRDAAASVENSITVPRDAIVTPLARDMARDRGITIVVGEFAGTLTGPVHPSVEKVVAMGSDHGGFDFKEEIKSWLSEQGWKVVDVGTDSVRSCDYPDFAYAVGRMVADGRAGFGIMIDGAGMGSAIVCNKIPGIRAAAAHSEFTAWNARAHNNANVLTLGSRALGIESCKRIAATFLGTDFEGGRHERRVRKLQDVEDRFSRKPG